MIGRIQIKNKNVEKMCTFLLGGKKKLPLPLSRVGW